MVLNRMNETDWQNVKNIFLAALEKDASERVAYLDSVCNGDGTTRIEVESLLASHSKVDDFIETPAFQTNEVFERNNGRIDQRFGAYTIEREIGHGGMGAVFLARRNDGEFDQMVALKIVRQSIAESHVIERFKTERQILASLNHPNISRLLDGGVSATGEPFLAMEHIEGEPITEFASRQKLSVDDKLRLFVKVCSAVAYAHRNLVVHRDIKPSNILVTADGEPKLLDFGLAKLTDESLQNDPSQTQTAFRALTPAYASPEQLKGEPITTSSDVYSLGIVLFELLTGDRPFHFEGRTLDEIIRTITASQPALPSRTAASASQLKGDLDNIILTALRNEPERRYRSVELFADDIERHLKGLPVSARSNTFRYRSGKFVKRHKVAVLAASLILLSLIGGIVASIWQARRAEREKLKAEVVNTFLQNLLGSSNPVLDLSRKNGHDTTVKELLDQASAKLETEELSNQPEVKAELQTIIGNSYLQQGQYEAAAKNLESALALKTSIYGENSLETLKTMVAVADLWLVRGNNTEANKFYRQSIEIFRTEQRKGNIHADYLFDALDNFAVLTRARGDSKEAEVLLREALALAPQMSPEEKNDLSIAESVLALILVDQGKLYEAETIVRKKVDEDRAQANNESPSLAASLNLLGGILSEKGEYETAETNLTEAETIYRKLYSQNFLPIGDSLRVQALNLYFQNRLPEATAKINETLEIYRKGTSTQYINYPTAIMIRGLILNKQGNSVEAEPILREAVRIRTENLPKEHFLRALALGALGECLVTLKRFAEAEPLLTESYNNLRTSQGEENPRTLLAKSRLDKLYEAKSKSDGLSR